MKKKDKKICDKCGTKKIENMCPKEVIEGLECFPSVEGLIKIEEEKTGRTIGLSLMDTAEDIIFAIKAIKKLYKIKG